MGFESLKQNWKILIGKVTQLDAQKKEKKEKCPRERLSFFSLGLR
jgi:hypothetical protein